MSQNDLTELESVNQLLESDEFKAYSALPGLDKDSAKTIPILKDIVDAATNAAREQSLATETEDVSSFFNETPATAPQKPAPQKKQAPPVQATAPTPKAPVPKAPVVPKAKVTATTAARPVVTSPVAANPVAEQTRPASKPAEDTLLPKDIMEKLHASQVTSQQIMQDIGNFTPAIDTKQQPPQPILDSITAADLQLEEKLMADAENILQDVVDEFVPAIEAELRSRLQTEMHLMLQEIVALKVRETLGK